MANEKFSVKFAEGKENNAAYKLRYREMILEYRPDNVKDSGLDFSDYDKFAKQAICIDNETGEVVGCYRIITSDYLPKGARFVCEEEFDISKLKATGARIAELSRACVKKEYRSSMVLMLLLRFVIKYIKENDFKYVIGEASFYGTDKSVYQKELSYLAHYHSFDDNVGIKSLEEDQVEILDKDDLDAFAIKRALPPLIRAYLSFGVKVSKDSFTDREFGSVDVFVLLDGENYNSAYILKLLKI